MENKKRSSIVDSPRSSEEDLLGLDNHAKALIEFIENANTPLTIAIQGEWGSGKTSMMNQLKSTLCDKKDSAFYGIWLNTWQFALLSDEELILSKIVVGLTDKIIKALKNIHPEKYNDNINKVKDVAKLVLKSAIKIGASKVAGKVGTEFVDSFTGSDELTLTVNDLRDRLTDVIVSSISDDKNKKGYIFFIDDLDRIEPLFAVKILELLKNIFEIQYCLFLLAIDYDVVVKGLEPKFGLLTESNEREFRSFFDKIIQLPFTMPVSRYEIDDFIVKILDDVDYLTEEEKKSEDFKKNLSLMAKYSVGKNPRALKRLTNSLSLIKIFNELDAKRESYNNEQYEKLINIGLICCQIAYPFIYRLLNSEPDFKKWNEKTATRHKLKALEEEQVEILEQSEEFDEEWERVLYRACQRDPYLSKNTFKVSLLLNFIADQIPTDKQSELGEIINAILSLSSVTNVASNESTQIARVSLLSKFSGFDEFATQLDPKNQNNNFISLIKHVHDDIKNTFPDSEVSYSKERVSFFNNKFPRRKKSFIQIGIWKPPVRIRVEMKKVNEEIPDGACPDWLERERWRHFCFEVSKVEKYNEQVKKYIKRSYDLGIKGVTLKT